MKSNKNKNRNARTNTQRHLRIESLENRQLMAAEIMLDQGSGILYIEGTDATRDVASIRIYDKGTASVADDRVLVSLFSKTDQGTGRLTGNFRLSAVNSIVFNGYADNDRFTNDTSIPSEADGGAGFDILLGGYGNDSIYGGDQTDYIDGRAGNDSLYGGAHNDVIFGDKGNDVLYGNAGSDRLFGGGSAAIRSGVKAVTTRSMAGPMLKRIWSAAWPRSVHRRHAELPGRRLQRERQLIDDPFRVGAL